MCPLMWVIHDAKYFRKHGDRHQLDFIFVNLLKHFETNKRTTRLLSASLIKRFDLPDL